ncbi:hypothetical protein [Pseudoduganella aquatica]|uniref:hypothetical protein n=1 Tax=Pseudoduganella aquatica TaxID=2660641 RepID=UPI001E4E4B85|nr:hypothetical protein [Pseudoduganella aquatica]
MSKVPREWIGLTYFRPRRILDGLRRIEQSGHLNGLPYKVASLRTHKLKLYLEGRQAALFCHGMSARIGREVSFALFESADFDIVARYEDGGATRFVPVQLKELPPVEVNSRAELQHILDKLDAKLTDSKDLVVAIHINRDIKDLRPAELRIPRNLGQIWLYGGRDRAQHAWYLIGDLLKDPNLVTDFHYPSPVLYSASWRQELGGRLTGPTSLFLGPLSMYR